MYLQTSITNKTNRAIFIVLLLLAFSIPLSTSITNILLTLFLLLWLIEGNFNTKIAYVWQYKACFASILILVTLVVGGLYSSANWPDILFYLKKMSKLVYVPFLIYYFNDLKQRAWTINSLIISGMLTTIIGIIYAEPSPFKNTIDTSLVVITITFLLMHKLDIKNKLYLNICIILSILVNVFYLFYISAGRTSQLIFLLLIPVFFIQKFNFSQKKIIILPMVAMLLTIILCSLYSTPLKHRWTEVADKYTNYQNNPTNYEQNSISQRLAYYKNTLNLIKQKPLLGWGTGTFPIVYKDFITKHNLFTINQHSYLYPSNPHNEYLLFGTQLGICGIGLLVWLFYILFKTSFMIKSDEKYILQGTVIIISIGCLTNSWLLDFTSGHLFIILTAISLGALPNVRIKRDHQRI